MLVYTRNRAGLPGTVVAHYMPGGHCIEDHPPIDRGWYYWTGSIMDITPATHWMPLPPAPLPRTEGEQ